MVLGTSRYVSGCNACHRMFVAYVCFRWPQVNITEGGSYNFS